MNKIKTDREDAERLRNFVQDSLTRRGTPGADQAAAINAMLGDLRAWRAGAELIREGTLLHEPMVLAHGWATRQRVLSDGRRQIFSFVLPGDLFGLCAWAGGKSIYTTSALTEVMIGRAPFLATCLGDQGPLREFGWEMLALEEGAMANQVVRLGRQSAYERLVHLLLEFHYRLDAVGLVDQNGFTMPCTQEVLSDALGLSAVHTNRTLQQLRREHLIETKGAIVKLNNLPLLCELADFQVSRTPLR